ncbi:MAG TPA: TetR/AcrR family transcriptional regulator [Solirubrobacteraceae bacterium]|nr:TetR/AcrR family transcriptional regulator [Solirubrobacteraceae bacterium]
MSSQLSTFAVRHSAFEYASLTFVIDRRPYNKVARALAQQRTQEALLDAADEEFYKHDWHGTSLERLATKAGVTKQTLLRHFGSKDGLLLHALLRGYEQVREQRWSVPTGDVEGTVENLLDHYETWGERSLRISAWMDNGPALLAKLSQTARQVHYDWVEYAFSPWIGSLDGQARVRCRAALIALCDVHTWWLLSHDLGLERPEVRATLTQAIEGVIGVKK